MSFLGVKDRSKGRSRSRSRSRSRTEPEPVAPSAYNDPSSLYETRQPSHNPKADQYKPRTPGGFDDDDEDEDEDGHDNRGDENDKDGIVMDWNDLPPHERPGHLPPGYPSAQKPYVQAQRDDVKYAPPLEPTFTDYRRNIETNKAPPAPKRTYSNKSDGYEHLHRYAEMPNKVKYSDSTTRSPPRTGSYTATSRPVNGAPSSGPPQGFPPYHATANMPYPAAGMPQMSGGGPYGNIAEAMPGGRHGYGSHGVPPPPPPPQDDYGLTRHLSLTGVGPHHREPSRQSSLSTGMGMLSVDTRNHAPSMYPGMAPPASPLLEAYQGTYQSMPSPLLMPHFDDNLDDIPTLEPRHANGHHKKGRRGSEDSQSPPRRSKAKSKARFEEDEIDDLPTLEPRRKKDRRDSRGSDSPPSKSKRKPRFADDDRGGVPEMRPRGVKDSDESDESDSNSDEKGVRSKHKGRTGTRDVDAVAPSSKSKHRRSKSYTHSNALPARSPSRKGRVVMYDAEKDAKTIGAALNHTNVDKQPLIDILPTLSHDQLMELRASYKKVAKVQGRGINIAKHIKLKTSGSFGKLMYVLALGRWESEGHWANYWYQSHSAKRELLIEALMGRTNQEIKLIKADFQDKRYDDSLTKCMEKELKADKFRTAVLLALEERRQEEHDVWPMEYVNRDVDTLYDALRRKEGGETAILQIVVTRSDPHLRRVLQSYQRKYDSNFAKEALKKSNNLVGEVIAHILNGVINQTARDAMLLQHALSDLAADGKGQDRTELLISRLVRMHWEKKEFHQIKEEYRTKFRRNLEDDVEKYVRNEDTREACLGLCDV